MADPPDGELLLRFRDGNLAAFDRLVDRYQGRLLAFARSTLSDATAAEDVVQETFLRLVQRTPEIGSDGLAGPWLFKVCRHLAYDAMKTHHRERRRRERAARPEAVPPSAAAEQAEIRQRVAAELERLPAKQREVLRLKVQDGMSYREIAEATGLKPGYIGWLIHQGLAALTDRLNAAGVL